ncbi:MULTISPECIES: hypothetical protein [Burkholderia cepacia complex]|uniref:hypothetical protein n=1 Tax=Burkholderia cepacia complex TaxID=87882 RepID=UPI0007556D5D|nr:MULTISPECIES: hypothetical protein [Burkholderia cepacia complex]KVQ85541.1 hypothetical protein WK07_04395 [Burkholderia multivorans]PRF55348.1 hypothetical protein C6Q11_05390 [Burkholderia multivorans]QTD88773.1 hypothetical protein J4G50_13200 [Burkholderia anthina]
MNLTEWLKAYDLNEKGITPAERERRRSERDIVLANANTNIRYLQVAKCRGSIGMETAQRLQAASKNTRAPFRIADQWPAE